MMGVMIEEVTEREHFRRKTFAWILRTAGSKELVDLGMWEKYNEEVWKGFIAKILKMTDAATDALFGPAT